MKSKIRLCIGWFGVLTPVYAAGVLTVLLASGYIDTMFIVKVVAVSVINCFIGHKLLKTMVVKKRIKRETDGN